MERRRRSEGILPRIKPRWTYLCQFFVTEGFAEVLRGGWWVPPRRRGPTKFYRDLNGWWMSRRKERWKTIFRVKIDVGPGEVSLGPNI